MGRLTLVNGVPAVVPTQRGTIFVQPEGRGFLRLTVMDSRGVSDSVVVRLQ